MSTNAPMKQQQQNAPAQQQPKPTVEGILRASHAEFAKALPAHLKPDRMLRICLTEIRKNSSLTKCDPYSFIAAVMQAAQLGLEPGSGLGHAYLIPYKSECQLIIGYKGLVELARRSGKVSAIHAHAVYNDDHFDEGIARGIPYIDYKPVRNGKPRSEDDVRLVFAIAQLTTGEMQWAVMEKWEVDRIRGKLRYPSQVWADHYIEMAKKTAVRRLAKLLPQSPDLIFAQQLDDAASDGLPQNNHRVLVDAGILDASYTLQEPEPDAAKNAEVHASRDTAKPVATAAESEALSAARLDFDEAKQVALGKGLDLAVVLHGKLAELEASTDPAWIKAGTTMLHNAANQAGKK